jgi:hypothetical protein
MRHRTLTPGPGDRAYRDLGAEDELREALLCEIAFICASELRQSRTLIALPRSPFSGDDGA